MNNVQPSTPGFVLTSLSFGQNESKTLKHRTHAASVQPSSIAKFDYCLPPEEFNYFDFPDSEKTA